MDNSPDVGYLSFIIKGLVEFPDEVEIERTNDDMGVLLLVDVAPTDMGKIIGREGGHANAIRTIMRAYGMKNQERISIKINEPNNDDL